MREGDGQPTVAAIGDAISGCIQIGHVGPHDAAADCLLIDDKGRCVSPRSSS